MVKRKRRVTKPRPGALPPQIISPELPERPAAQPDKRRGRAKPFAKEKPADLDELAAGSTSLLDILAPSAVELKSRDYVVIDGIYHGYLYVAGYGYTTTVGNGWLSPLVEAGEGVNLNFIVKRQPKERLLSKIAQTTMVNRSRMREVGDTRQDYEELDSAISSGLYLKEQMNRAGEDFYYMHTLIEVTAEDAAALEQRMSAVETFCVSMDMVAKRCDYQHEQGFLSCLPLLMLDADIERKARRNVLTSGVAAAFPFASYELGDRNGVFLGLNMYNRSPCFLDFYDDYKYTNGNLAVCGNSGAGKTFTLQCIGGRLRQQGRQVIYVVPKKGHEFRPLCEQIGGQYIRLAPSSADCINIMDIRYTNLDIYSSLRELSVREDSVLADKIAKLIVFYSLLKRDISEEDKNYLDHSLVECYRRRGIGFDNASLYAADGVSMKEMPTLRDWYEILRERQETEHLAVVLTRFVSGSAATMGGRTNVDTGNKYLVIDTSGMPEDLILPGIFWATEFATDIIMNSNISLSALIADELWSLVGANSNPLAAGYTTEMVKIIRGLGGLAITSTQGMQDLFSLENGKYGKGILDSSRFKLIMQMEEQEAKLIQSVLNLSDDEVRQITAFRRGEGLLCVGYNHVPIAFHASEMEYQSITTSATDLRRRGGLA